LPNCVVAWRQLANVFKECLWAGNVEVFEIARERGAIEPRLDWRQREKRLDLRCEGKNASVFVYKERLLSETISGEKQQLPPGIPKGECEHAAEPVKRRPPPPTISLEQHLAVATGAEDVAGLLELVAQLAEIVDLAIVGEHHSCLAVGDRL